jgi:hypothetical protein
MNIAPSTLKPIKYYGHGLLRNRKFAEAFLGRNLIRTGRYTEMHDYLEGFVEKVISKDELRTIPGIGEAAQMSLCAVVKTVDGENYAKVLALHLTEDEYRMVQMLNFDGLVFQDEYTRERNFSPRISLLRDEYSNLGKVAEFKDDKPQHVYALLGITEEKMIHLGKIMGDEIAAKLGIQHTTIEGAPAAPEGKHHHGRGGPEGR